MLIIHQTSDGKPFALDYFISPVPHDSSCPTTKAEYNFNTFRQTSNTTLSLRSPRLPPLYDYNILFFWCLLLIVLNRPELRKPPPLTPQGEPVQPVPEQTFVQKYWIYGLVLIAALRELHRFDLDIQF